MQTAKDIMTTNVVTIQASATTAEAMEVLNEKNLRDLIVEPATSGDSYGMVTEEDIVYKVAALGKNPTMVTVSDVMTKPCIEVSPDMTVQEVAQLFANNHVHRAPVIQNELLGIITVFDIVRETMWWQD
ncbi:MAG: CBS domain-containing protein [Anaerolineae bacterium]|nr:CBS domain-containing protein [Anaerolineae bacterium]